MEAITSSELVIYALVLFGASILSGIAGAGGGFLMTPLLIFLGLSPAQAVATGKLSGLSVSVGSLTGLRSVKPTSKKQMSIIIALALVIGLLAPQAITRLDSDFYRRTLGFLLLVMVPILIWKRVGHIEQKPGKAKKAIGYLLLIVSLGMQAVFSGGLGTLVNIVLMAFLGMPAITANITKRYSQLVLNSVIVLSLLFADVIVWPIAIIGIAVAGVGGHIGGKIAVKKGNGFVMAIFIVLMIVSAIELLFG